MIRTEKEHELMHAQSLEPDEKGRAKTLRYKKQNHLEVIVEPYGKHRRRTLSFTLLASQSSLQDIDGRSELEQKDQTAYSRLERDRIRGSERRTLDQ